MDYQLVDKLMERAAALTGTILDKNIKEAAVRQAELFEERLPRVPVSIQSIDVTRFAISGKDIEELYGTFNHRAFIHELNLLFIAYLPEFMHMNQTDPIFTELYDSRRDHLMGLIFPNQMLLDSFLEANEMIEGDEDDEYIATDEGHVSFYLTVEDGLDAADMDGGDV